MSALPTPSQSKSWWSRSKSSKDIPSKLNTLVASAIGKKPKKPTLTIQEPPPSSLPRHPSPGRTIRDDIHHTSLHSPHSLHPPSTDDPLLHSPKDPDQVSDFHTLSEPRTPSDHPRDRSSYQHSVLTLSDADPFASGGVFFSSFSADTIRSSVYSDNSLLDPNSKRSDLLNSRISYCSSSSNSHSNPSDSYDPRYQLARHVHNVPAPAPTLSSSHSALTGRSRRSTPSSSPSFLLPASPATLRPRGMTVGAPVRPSTASATLGFTSTSSSSAISSPSLRRKASDTFTASGGHSSVSSSFSTPLVSFSHGPFMADSHVAASPGPPPPSSARPMVLVRKASSSRLLVPPLNAAPPNTDLPPTPSFPSGTKSLVETVGTSFELTFPDLSSSSTSSLGFASQLDLTDIGGPNLSPPATVRDFNIGSSSSPTKHNSSSAPSTPSKTVRKALSQSSLLGRHCSTGTLSPPPSTIEDPSPPPVKVPKKQRSFHHSRIPLPPLPSLRYVSSHHSSNSPTSADSPSIPSPDSRKPSVAPQTRKRLFSGPSLRRNSQSQPSSPPLSPSPSDDDVRSMVSTDSNFNRPSADRRAKPVMMSFSTFGNQVSLVTGNACVAPAWDEPLLLNRRGSQSEYVPQYIMSPEALRKLEEELAAESRQREKQSAEPTKQSAVAVSSSHRPKAPLGPEDVGLRSLRSGSTQARSRANSALSGLSSTTLAFGRDDTNRDGNTPDATSHMLSPRKRSISAKIEYRGYTSDALSTRSSLRSISAMRRPSSKPSARSSRPSTTQTIISLQSSPDIGSRHSPERPTTALPPPPRARPSRDQYIQEADASGVYKRASVLPLHPLSPPPRRKPSQASFTTIDSRECLVQPLRPPSAFDQQKALQRRSLMKKPSFLEIEDDLDNESDGMDSPAEMPLELLAAPLLVEGSFLDLDKGKDSFDSYRSNDEAISVF